MAGRTPCPAPCASGGDSAMSAPRPPPPTPRSASRTNRRKQKSGAKRRPGTAATPTGSFGGAGRRGRSLACQIVGLSRRRSTWAVQPQPQQPRSKGRWRRTGRGSAPGKTSPRESRRWAWSGASASCGSVLSPSAVVLEHANTCVCMLPSAVGSGQKAAEPRFDSVTSRSPQISRSPLGATCSCYPPHARCYCCVLHLSER